MIGSGTKRRSQCLRSPRIGVAPEKSSTAPPMKVMNASSCGAMPGAQRPKMRATRRHAFALLDRLVHGQQERRDDRAGGGSRWRGRRRANRGSRRRSSTARGRCRMIASKTPRPPGTFDATPAICASRKMPRKWAKPVGSASGSRT